MSYLGEAAEAGKLDIGTALTGVMRQGGPGAYHQVWQILKLRFSGRGLAMKEYYDFGLWRPAEGPALRRELLAGSRFHKFNFALEMPGKGPPTAAVQDKLATEAILLAAGLPAVRTRAAFAPDGAEVPPHVTALRDRAAVVAYLGAPGPLPVFGKPRRDTFARGAAGITAVAPDGQSVTFLSGHVVPVWELAVEIAADWSSGYLFQPMLRMAGELLPHIGPAMASARITTLLTDRGVEPWYAVLRLPAKKAMHDGDALGTRVWALIDLASGEVGPLRDLKDPVAPAVTHWLDAKRPLTGLCLPHWKAAMDAAMAAHGQFRGHGILGWDIFLTDDGPLISEGNANPGPVYQPAAARGILNPEMQPLYDRALAFAKAVNARRQAA